MRMKLYNQNLEIIENKEKKEKISKIAEKNINFLVEKYGINEDLLRERYDKMAVVERNEKNFLVEKNGEKYELENKSAAAFCTKKNQQFDGKTFIFENGLYVSNNNSEHVITHELFHILSENIEMNYEENGIGYDKRGVEIIGYNKKDEVCELELNAKGLNEGITEMLAMEVDGIDTPELYTSQVYLAQILNTKQDNCLLDAYFSKDYKKFHNFLEKFDQKQSLISSNKLVELSTNSNDIMNVDVLKGCVQYSLSFCENIEQLKNEGDRLTPILKNMKNNWMMEYSEEDFDIKNFFYEIMVSKKQEIEEKSVEKNSIDLEER